MKKNYKSTILLFFGILISFISNAQKADEVLFEIRDQFNVPVFTVTADGVRFYVKEYTGKGTSGGFAVGQYNSAKGTPDTTFFFVSGDSTRVYSKVPKGKAISGGFAVGQYNSAKGASHNFMYITDENYMIGHNAGKSLTTGRFNLFLGYESGMNTDVGSENIFLGYKSGHLNEDGDRNVFLGHASGYSNISGFSNVAIGDSSFYASQAGHYNVIIGYRAGYTSTASHNNTYIGAGAGKLSEGTSNTFIGNSSGLFNSTGGNNVALGILAGLYSSGDENVFLGSSAGFGNGGGSGSGNIFIGFKAGYDATGDDQLIIENSDSSSPLIYGDFFNNHITFNSKVGIGATPPGLELHIKQTILNKAIKIEHQSNTNNWETGIGLNTMNYKFFYNNVSMADIASVDGAYIQSSDKSLKKDIKNLNPVLEKVKELNPSSYLYKNSKSKSIRSIGFIAQDVELLFPDLVREYDNGLKGIVYDGFSIIAIKAIQEQQDQIESLKKENILLKKEIEKINSILTKNN